MSGFYVLRVVSSRFVSSHAPLWAWSLYMDVEMIRKVQYSKQSETFCPLLAKTFSIGKNMRRNKSTSCGEVSRVWAEASRRSCEKHKP